MAGNIQTAFDWAVETCNKSNVGYSQDYRNEQTVNGITYYDCSSFIWYSLKAGGFDVVGAYESALWGYEGNAVTTHYLEEWLLELGFKEITISNEWKAGDVLWRDGHTEMVYSGRTTMGAHSSTYDLPDQVSINSNPSSVSSWTKCFRYESGSSGNPFPTVTKADVTSKNGYLTDSQMLKNATYVYQYFITKGWTPNAICGMLGNMKRESNINPKLWQSLDEGNTSLGFGLTQWTPATKLINWANSEGLDYEDIDTQLLRIEGEFTGKYEQYYKTDAYPLTASQFIKSTQTPEYLAMAFLKNYERAGVEASEERTEYARYCYDYFTSFDSPSGGGSDNTGNTRKWKGNYKFVLYSNRRRKTWTNRNLLRR
jgi:hypothetical protein